MTEDRIEVSNRRRFVRKLLSLAAISSLAPLLLGERVQRLYAKTNLTPEGTNGTTGSFVGADNNNQVWDDYGVITGGQNNTAGINDGNTTDQKWSTVGGGGGNTASAEGSTVGGGSNNRASGGHSTVGGGDSNIASGPDSTVGGGAVHIASGTSSTVSGGDSNIASGVNATVGGGAVNMASGNDSTIGGGVRNTASGAGALVGGGGFDGNPFSIQGNTASGNASTVSGGLGNMAGGDYSFAAGRRAIIGTGGPPPTPRTHNGTFLFADSSDFDFRSATGNEFAARATGGLRFVNLIDGSGIPVDSGTMVFKTGNVGVGTTSPNAAALLDLSSTTKGFLPPRMTTAQRDSIPSPPAGLMIYNTTTNKMDFFNGTTWKEGGF